MLGIPIFWGTMPLHKQLALHPVVPSMTISSSPLHPRDLPSTISWGQFDWTFCMRLRFPPSNSRVNSLKGMLPR
ncbi:BgTH12-06570 [Blumeria graminis f. sp. triticale]|uniref:BgTH12-06570 n=1 Tax=Blumeria graminis f. sp. triticale TaxID=1689686 RepID=A0A9W4D3Y1_BLUGR|nr:BgTH12-06570 [Blumeria graminis f. sp. triticale]